MTKIKILKLGAILVAIILFVALLINKGVIVSDHSGERMGGVYQGHHRVEFAIANALDVTV